MTRFVRRVASATVGSVVLAVIVINVADKRVDERRRAVASHCATVGWGHLEPLGIPVGQVPQSWLDQYGMQP